MTEESSAYRTDRAVLAVNGFAADGNMFVKNVKQRLEVRKHSSLSLRCSVDSHAGAVVPPCARERHASARHRTFDPDNAVRTEVLPVLRL